MKLKLLSVFIILILNLSCQQKKDIPKDVTFAFLEKFPHAKSIKWERESDIEWEAEFKNNGKRYSSNFLQDGTWVETEYEVNESDLPKNVARTLTIKFSKYEIKEMEFSETNDGIVYEFRIEKEDSVMEVEINLQGEIIKREIKKD